MEDDGQAGELWAATEDFPAIIAGRLHELMGRSHPLTQAPSLTRLTLESKRPQTCYDALADPRTNHNFVHNPWAFARSWPCLAYCASAAVGVGLVVSLDAYREFTDEQIELALGVANTVAPAIENARLHQRLEQLAVLQERARLAREVQR